MTSFRPPAGSEKVTGLTPLDTSRASLLDSLPPHRSDGTFSLLVG